MCGHKNAGFRDTVERRISELFGGHGDLKKPVFRIINLAIHFNIQVKENHIYTFSDKFVAMSDLMANLLFTNH